MKAKELNQRRDRATRCNAVVILFSKLVYSTEQLPTGMGRLDIDARGRVLWFDGYSERYLHVTSRWLRRGFTGGGTWNQIVRDMGKWIRGDKPVFLGPWLGWRAPHGPSGPFGIPQETYATIMAAAWSLGVARLPAPVFCVPKLAYQHPPYQRTKKDWLEWILAWKPREEEVAA